MSSPDRPSPAPPGSLGQTRLGVVLLYACFAALWILLSDRAVTWLLSDPELIVLANTSKGWLFVAVTSVLLFLLLRRLDQPAQAAPPPEPGTARRHRLALLLLTTGVLLGLMAFSVWYSFKEEKAQAHTRLQAISETRARELGHWHAERLRDAGWAQKSYFLRETWMQWSQSRSTADALRLRQYMFRFFIQDGVFPRVEIVDAAGHMALDSSVQAAAPASPLGPPDVHPVLHHAVLEALTSDQVQRAGPWLDAAGRMRLAFVAPLAANSAWPAAIVLHLDPPESFHPALQSQRLPVQTADLFLFREDGEHLLMLSNPRYEPDAALRKRLPLSDNRYLSVRALRSSGPGVLLEGLDYRERPAYGVVQRIEGTDWWLLAKQDRSELLHLALVRSAWVALAGLMALLAFGTVLYLHDERMRLLDSAREIEELKRIERDLAESEAQYRLLAENTTDVLWLYDLERKHYLFVSPSVERQIGYRPEELLSRSMEELQPADEVAQVSASLEKRLLLFAAGDESRRTVTSEGRFVHRDGRIVPLEIVSTLLADAQGRPVRILGVSRDISLRKQAEAELTRLSQAIEQSPASVIITGLDGRIEYVNPAFEQISGYRRDEVLGQKPALLRSGRTPPELYAGMWEALRAGQPWSGELINRHRSGREYVQSMNMAPLRDAQGQVTHYLAVQMDVTAQKNAEELARQLAWFDPLTGLPNRHRLLTDISEALQSHPRTHETWVLLLLNLDRFQTVNDALGHTRGDELLKQVGERLAQALRPNDRLAHLSADEFALLLHAGGGDTEAASAWGLRVARELQHAMEAPFRLAPGNALAVSCCIGITLLPLAPEESPSDALRRADTALHRAKEAGPGQTAFFDASMEQLIQRRFAIEQDLRRGLGADELRLYLQPQVDAQGRLVGAEALVRWQHPEHGLMPPGTFIPIAEESELITEIGRWVLTGVCGHLGALHREGLRLPIAVNISPRQFHQPGFVHVVQDTLQNCGALAEDLVIEITEGIVMDRMDSVVRKMSHLSSLGVKFSLDDFGTGYSSLSYLKRLPIDELKIDRSFVQDAPTDPNDAALVEAILSVARHLRLKVVAEGVETAEQAEFLRARGPVIQQGYLHGRPEPATELLTRWRRSQSMPA